MDGCEIGSGCESGWVGLRVKLGGRFSEWEFEDNYHRII